MAHKKGSKRLVLQRTDAGNAEVFAALYKDQVRYDHCRGRWLIWRKNWWVEDRTGEVLRMAKNAARSRLKRAVRLPDGSYRDAEVKWAIKSESEYQLNAMLSLAKSEPPIADEGANWDANPWLLGVANGVVDLRTGKLREARPEDRITRRSPVAFDPTAKCPRFEQFLAEIFNGDEELIGFVRRAVGYSLTGCTNEQCLFLCYGSGSNGKSTLFRILHFIFGEYGCNLPFSAFELTARSPIPSDVAMLEGQRFVTAAETAEGARLNEARIKALTGEDPVTARRLYKDFVTFPPTHKLWLAFNHKPIVGDDSEGFWRRVRLIPFTRQFRSRERDGKLFDVLKAESPGILAWAVSASREWRQKGLGVPSVVDSATDAYRRESDHLGNFISERCLVQEGAQVSVAGVWEAYVKWCAETGECLLDRRVFGQRMQSQGFQKQRRGHERTRVWVGLRLGTDTEEQCLGSSLDSESADVDRLRTGFSESSHREISKEVSRNSRPPTSAGPHPGDKVEKDVQLLAELADATDGCQSANERCN